MATRRTPSGQLLQLKIELAHIKPLIWRRVVVPETITLAKLHGVIQIVMGWTDSHLHEFEIAGERYGAPDPDWDLGEPIVSEKQAKLGSALGGMKSFRYVYDFGDNWEHKIKVEKVLPPDACPVPFYIGGANACPPEDVGGPWGYADFLEAMADPAHREHENRMEWWGDIFDPVAIDPETIDKRLQRIKL